QGKAEAEELAHYIDQIRYSRRIARSDMNVGRERIGRTALRNGSLRNRVIETVSPVAEIEHDAAPLGFERRRSEPAILHDVGRSAGDISRSGVAVGQNIAWAQHFEDLCHQLARFNAADMAHDLAAGFRLLAGRNRSFQRFEAE